MVGDPKTNQLISWNPSGTSFLVCNATLFSQEVLPIHFKHCNFSSFVRQLNMYGFHKINKSPRGQRGCNENEIWEFSHKHFQYGRPDSLIDIKRKAMDSELLRRETGDIHTSFAMVQLSQADLLQQFHTLQENYSNLLTQFEDMKKTQLQQQIILRQLLENKQQPQQPSSSLSVSSAASTILSSQSSQHLPQHHHQQQHMMYTNAINPIMSNLASPTDDVFQFLPPSPAHSDNKSHSRSSSLESYSV
ncbi:HSF-type DNA-binding-domain-containing protein [Cunninghamella echinulata]|nr:HSF-type DNA-binding-domain-containing protein [Cunninghamella echinulata]